MGVQVYKLLPLHLVELGWLGELPDDGLDARSAGLYCKLAEVKRGDRR